MGAVTCKRAKGEQQQAVADWLAEQQDALASDKKISLTSYLRLVALGLPVLLWHVTEARLKSAGKVIPQTRAQQEQWFKNMPDIEAPDPEASDMEHRYDWLL